MGVAVRRRPDARVAVAVPVVLDLEPGRAVVPPELPRHRVGRVAGLVGAVVGDVVDPVELVQEGDVRRCRGCPPSPAPSCRWSAASPRELAGVAPVGAEVAERGHRLARTHVGPHDAARLVHRVGLASGPSRRTGRARWACRRTCRRRRTPSRGTRSAAPRSSLRPKYSDAPRCGQFSCSRPDPPAVSRNATRFSPSSRTRSGRAARLGDLRRQAGRRPVTAQQLAHQRPRAHPGQDLVLFRPQHRTPPASTSPGRVGSAG